MPERGARFGGHPLHPALVSLPIGLWTFSLAADLVHWLGGGSIWQDLALYTLGSGIVGAVIAAVPGFIDYLTITDSRVRDIAVAHMATMLVVVGVFAVSFWLRWTGTVGVLPVGVSALGVALLGIGAWVGGEMVYVHGQGMAADPLWEGGPRKETGPSQRRLA
jgi:uncharacterized membrane protein